jgi:hypothetical protein
MRLWVTPDSTKSTFILRSWVLAVTRVTGGPAMAMGFHGRMPWQSLSTGGGRRRPRYMLALRTWGSGTSQECFSAVHSDTPATPHVVHIAIHKHVLTIFDTGPSFAMQESPGSRPHVASGEGRRTARSGASGRSPCRSGARGPRLCRRTRLCRETRPCPRGMASTGHARHRGRLGHAAQAGTRPSSPGARGQVRAGQHRGGARLRRAASRG